VLFTATKIGEGSIPFTRSLIINGLRISAVNLTGRAVHEWQPARKGDQQPDCFEKLGAGRAKVSAHDLDARSTQ
jgi:hypothetical protein